jgi:hypothetical protein
MLKVYLDVEKTPKNEKEFTIIRNLVDFVSLLKKEEIDLLSLDHNLADSRLALDAITFLIRKNIFIQYINFHSFSKTGSLLIKKRLEKKFPDIVITMNSHL